VLSAQSGCPRPHSRMNTRSMLKALGHMTEFPDRKTKAPARVHQGLASQRIVFSL
jgi:hypothetical protein